MLANPGEYSSSSCSPGDFFYSSSSIQMRHSPTDKYTHKSRQRNCHTSDSVRNSTGNAYRVLSDANFGCLSIPLFCIAHSSAKNGYFGEYLNVFVMFWFGFVRGFGADARGFSEFLEGFYSSCNRNICFMRP